MAEQPQSSASPSKSARAIWDARSDLKKFKQEIASVSDPKKSLALLKELIGIASVEIKDASGNSKEVASFLDERLKQLEKNKEIEGELQKLELRKSLAVVLSRVSSKPGKPSAAPKKKGFVGGIMAKMSLGVTGLLLGMRAKNPDGALGKIANAILGFFGGGDNPIEASRRMRRSFEKVFSLILAKTVGKIPLLKGMVDGSTQRVEQIDMEVKLETYAAETDGLVFNPEYSASSWNKLRKAAQKSSTAPADLAEELLASFDEDHPGESHTVTLKELLLYLDPEKIKTDKETQKKAKQSGEEQEYLEKVQGVFAGKEVTFGTETKLEGKQVTVVKTELDANGKPNTGTAAAKLLEASTKIVNASITVTKGSVPQLRQEGKTIAVEVPLKSSLTLAQINLLVGVLRSDNRVKGIRMNETMLTDKPRLKLIAESNTVFLEFNSVTEIDKLISTYSQLKTGSRKIGFEWEFEGGKWIETPKTA